MVTKLQRKVEIIEDRHFGEHLNRSKFSDLKRMHGSVLCATSKELAWIRKTSIPMDMADNGNAKNTRGNIPAWKRELQHEKV